MNKLIKLSKVCKDFGICRQTLYSWNKLHKINLIKTLGGQYYVTQETYDFFLNITKNNLKESATKLTESD